MEPIPFDAFQPGGGASPGKEGGWWVVGTAVRGTAHQRMNLPCQDVVGYRVLPGGILLAAVADGAGTASFSDQGAWTAVEKVLGHLEIALGGSMSGSSERLKGIMRDVFRTARETILQLAEESGVKPREFACTLAAAAVSPGVLVTGLVGDGVIIFRDSSGELFCATRLQRGEYANETHFLVEEDALEVAVFEVIDRPVNALALMSDGLVRLALKMPAQEPYLPFFQPLFHFVEMKAGDDDAVDRLAVFLNSARVNERTDDDKALVLAVARSSSGRAEFGPDGSNRAGAKKDSE